MDQIRETFILHRRLPSGASCALNLTNPRGVSVLNAEEAQALDAMLDGDSRVLEYPSISEGPPAHSVARRLNFKEKTAVSVTVSRRSLKKLTVWVHTSSACNLSCSYCYIPQLRKALTPERAKPYLMPEQVSSAMISGLIAVCKQEGFELLSLKFAGGEPTLNWAGVVRTCHEAQRACEAAGIQTTFRMLTNGVFDPETVIPDAVALKMSMSISVDGDPEAHNEIRFVTPQVFEIFKAKEEPMDVRRPKRRGSWAIVKANIDRLLDVGIRPYLLCTVDERNYKELDELVDYCAARKLGFRLSPVRDSTTYKLPGIQDAITSKLVVLYRRIGEAHPIDLPIGVYARFAEWDFQRPRTSSCVSCRGMLAVGEAGQVASCQMRLDHPVATVRDEKFGQVFDSLRHSQDYTFFIHPESKTGKCAGCSFRFTCAGGCPEHTRMVFGSNNHASPWCDLYTALLPEYVSAIGRQKERAQDVAQHASSAAPSLAAQWYGDPLERHEYRYWNGTSWTDHIATKGEAGKDPLTYALGTDF